MKSLKKMILMSFALILSGMCYAQVKSDYDKAADFTKYKTYSFAGWEHKSDSILTTFDKKRILDAFKNELDSRGMTLVDSNADLSITLYLVVSKESSVSSYTNFNGAMGFRGRWGWGAGGMMTANTTYDKSYYQEGTLVVSFFDSSTKDLVWQGVSKSTIDEDPQKRDKSVPKTINKLMKKYPVKVIKQSK